MRKIARWVRKRQLWGNDGKQQFEISDFRAGGRITAETLRARREEEGPKGTMDEMHEG
jgi:hypothetical protein